MITERWFWNGHGYRPEFGGLVGDGWFERRLGELWSVPIKNTNTVFHGVV